MNRILLDGSPVKPSRDITGNNIITVRKPPVSFVFKVIMPVENRQPAKLVSNYIEDLTPVAEKVKLGIRQTALSATGRKEPAGQQKRNGGLSINGMAILAIVKMVV